MNKTNLKKGITAALISIAGLAVGFALMMFPFRLFDSLNETEMKILFAAELTIYFTIGSAFFLAREKSRKKEQAKREKQRRRRTEIAKTSQEMNDALCSVIFAENAA